MSEDRREGFPGPRRLIFLLRMVFRFLFRSQNIGVLPYLTVFALLSVSIGVATLIIVLSVMNGFSTTLQRQLVGIYSPIRVYKKQPEPVSLPALKKEVESIEGIQQVVGVVEGEALFKADEAHYQGGRVMGFSDWREDRLPVDSPPDTGIYLGKQLARSLWVRAGDEVTVIRPGGQQTPFGMLPGGGVLPVRGTVRTGFQDMDRVLGLVSIAQARRLFELGNDEVGHAEIWIENRFRADVYKRRLEAELDDKYRFVTWTEANPALFEALKLERTVTFIVLVLIVLVASINILSMLVLSILQRRKQIAMMMSMGAGPKTILGLFLTGGMIITVVGLAIGFGLGLGGCFLLDNVFVIDLPPVYPISHLPVQVSLMHLVVIGGVSLLLGFLSSFYPAWAASRIDPAEVLRYG